MVKTDYLLGGGQKGILRTFTYNGLSELLQASYTLGDGQKELSELLLASYAR